MITGALAIEELAGRPSLGGQMASEPQFSTTQQTAEANDQGLNVYDDGFLRVEHDNYYVACGGKRISLPLKEFLVFSRLARSADRVVPSEEIWRSAWGDSPFNSLSLRVHIHRLRRTFLPFGLRIESMVGVGYCLSLIDEHRNQGVQALA
jgi:DNA-binding response OmpR family regulator